MKRPKGTTEKPLVIPEAFRWYSDCLISLDYDIMNCVMIENYWPVSATSEQKPPLMMTLTNWEEGINHNHLSSQSNLWKNKKFKY